MPMTTAILLMLATLCLTIPRPATSDGRTFGLVNCRPGQVLYNPYERYEIAYAAINRLHEDTDYNKTMKWQTWAPITSSRSALQLPVDWTERSGRGSVSIYYDRDMEDRLMDYFAMKIVYPLARDIADRCIRDAVIEPGVIHNSGGWAYVSDKETFKMEVVWGEKVFDSNNKSRNTGSTVADF